MAMESTFDATPDDARPRAGALPRDDARFDRDVFYVTQNFLALGKSKYFVQDEAGNELFYVERPTMRLFGRRANVTIYDNEKSMQPVLLLQQERRIEWPSRDYTLVDPNDGGRKIGRFSRNNFRSLLRRRWRIEDAGGVEVAAAVEDSVGMAFIRRIVDWIPFVDIAGMLIKTDFHLFSVDGDRQAKVGEFNRKLGIKDKYLLDLREDRDRRFDRRIAVALGILLDTAEAR
jgi:uncharacterized protein YxjI